VSQTYSREIRNQGLGFRLEGRGRSARFTITVVTWAIGALSWHTAKRGKARWWWPTQTMAPSSSRRSSEVLPSNMVGWITHWIVWNGIV